MGWDGPLTYRQFEVYQEWMRQEWNHPSRTDYYIMQIAETCNLTGEKLNWPLKFEFRQATAISQQKVDKQFKELEKQGFKVPKRMTKEDIEKAQQAMRHADLQGIKPKPVLRLPRQ